MHYDICRTKREVKSVDANATKDASAAEAARAVPLFDKILAAVAIKADQKAPEILSKLLPKKLKGLLSKNLKWRPLPFLLRHHRQ